MADHRHENANMTSTVEEVITTVTNTTPEVISTSYVQNSSPIVSSHVHNEAYRSYSPTVRTAEVHRSYSPVLRAAPVMRTSYVMEATPVMVPHVHAVQHACACRCSGAHASVGAVGGAYIATNSYANRGLFLQSGLANESLRATRSVSQANLGVQKSVSQVTSVPQYQNKTASYTTQTNVNQSSQQSVQQSNVQSIEVTSLKAKLAEAEATIAQYKNINKESNAKHEENNELKHKLKEVDVVKSYLAKADEDNMKLCEVVNRQDEVNNDLRRKLEDAHKHIHELQNELTVIPKLEEIIKEDNKHQESLKKALVEKETAIAHLNKVATDKSSEISHLNNQVRNMTSSINAHEEKAKVSVKGHDTLKTSITEKETHIVHLSTNVTQLNTRVTELTSTIALLEDKLELSNRNNNTLHTIISEREANLAEISGSIAQYTAEINALNSEICTLSMTVTEFENRFNITQRSLDVLHSIISEKEAVIAQLNLAVSEAYLQVDQYRVGAATEYTTRSVVRSGVNTGSVSNVHSESRKVTEVETRLSQVVKEKEDLGAVLNHKIATIKELTTRNANLEEQVYALEDLKSRVHMVVAENDRLNNIIIEKSTTISEWSERYEQLERLYLAVKETTEQLDAVKRRFQQAVKDTEMASTTVRRTVKTDVHQSRYSASSAEARTAGSPSKSPSDYVNSPYKVESYKVESYKADSLI